MSAKNSTRLTLFILSVVILGCASAKERADKAMEAGNFEDAIRNYELAVKREPNDPEAQAGLKRAREEYVGQKLIQVRLSRQGGNPQESMDLLLSVLSKEAEWQFFPGGKVAFTQEEESGYVTKYARQLVENDLKDVHPLKAEVFLRKYEPVIAVKELAPLRKRVIKAGQDHCHSFGKQVSKGKPYFTRWVASYCGYWGEGLPKATSDSLSETLFSDVKISMKDAQTLPPELQAMISQSLDQALTRTPWYDPKGKNAIQATVTGSFAVNKNKTGTVLVHTYDEQEQYVETAPVTRERTVTYTEWVNGNQITRQRQEQYTNYEPVTRTRTVKKDYRYPAWKHEQQLTINLGGELVVNGKTFNVSVNDKLNSDGIEHDENQPKIGLTPSRPNLPDPIEWQKGEVAKFADAFQAQAAKLWRDSFCDIDPSATTLADSGNRVAMCLRNVSPSEAVPSFADEWYIKNTGVGSRQAIELMESKRKATKAM